jgi:uncharacterized protein (TIGR00369 family)
MDFPVVIPFVDLLGFELVRFADGEAEIQLPLREDLLNSFGVAHGGLSMTLLDVVMAHAARSIDLALGDKAPGVVTIEMKTSFMRPGQGRLRATGRLLHRSTTMAFTEGQVFGGDGQLCAHATGTFKYVRRLPVGGRELKTLQPRSGGAPFDRSGSD